MSRTSQVGSNAPADVAAELEPDMQRDRFTATQRALSTLSAVLRNVQNLDAIVVFGDDQHEQFNDSNMPAVAIYHGDVATVKQINRDKIPWTGSANERHHISALTEWTNESYPGAPGLARHLLQSLTEQEFDVTRSDQLRDDIGLGHAFTFFYQRLWPDCNVPLVPIMLNTYYPPNQPTPQRCYKLGAAVRKAIESWDQGKRVAVIASGGLSHIVIDEELDRRLLNALQVHDVEKLCDISRSKLSGGTSEILNWIALGGAVGLMPMTLVDYIAGYRSAPGTGCGMAFAYWSA